LQDGANRDEQESAAFNFSIVILWIFGGVVLCAYRLRSLRRKRVAFMGRRRTYHLVGASNAPGDIIGYKAVAIGAALHMPRSVGGDGLSILNRLRI
jgi:hypothetical protein